MVYAEANLSQVTAGNSLADDPTMLSTVGTVPYAPAS
jgi:hypothetical protein